MRSNPRWLFVALAFAAGLNASAAVPAQGVTALLGEGERLLQQRKLEPAEKAFQAAVTANPRSVEALMKLAGVQIARNEFEAAVDTYKRAIALNANNAKAFIGLGIASLHNGDKSLTRAAFEEAIRLEPKRKAQLEPILARLDEAAQ